MTAHDPSIAGEYNRISQGNPGALTVMFQLTKANYSEVIVILDKLGIHGPDIWMLYKDECGEDLGVFIDTVAKRAEEVLHES